MDVENLIAPTPPPDKMFRIALWLVAVFGAAELAGLAVFYAGKWRAEYVAAHPKVTAPAVTPAPSAPAVAEKTTPAPATTTTSTTTAQTTPSTAALSVAEQLLKQATELRDKGDTTNALARLQDAAQRDPKNANVLAEMAMIYESIELYERSNETWKKIMEIGPSAGPLYELADMKLKTGVTPRATTTTTGPGLAGTSPLDAGTTRNDADGIPDGSSFGITEVTAADTPDADAETNMKLKISVKVRPNTPIDHTKVKIQVFFYDTVDNKEVVLTDADVSYEWLTPHHDWKDTNPEILAVTYLRSKNKTSSDAALAAAAASVTPPGITKKKTPAKKDTATDGADAGHRKYLGYIVRIYYSEQLQAVRADPTKLLNLFPPPLTAPQ
jgi:tetratricopeptide (TPR) repeat protein